MTLEKSAMITQQASAGQGWQEQQADLVTDPLELARLLDLDKHQLRALQAAHRLFPLRIPRAYLALVNPEDPDDPLLRQVLGVSDERVSTPGFSADPLHEAKATPIPGILHKYHGRALLLVTGACAVHCRYCFRRHFPYQDQSATGQRLEQALEWLARQQTISEVILSGGDPLSLSDRRLRNIIQRLECMPHLQRLRIHSRLPVVIPDRLTPEFAHLLSESRFASVLVVHANHPREVTPTLADGVTRLRQAGVTVLNQAVLLAGVNDQLVTQVALSHALFAAGILPYYLHLLDRVQGAAHFQVEADKAVTLYEAMRSQLSGYLLPRLVKEVPEAPAKMPVW